MCQIFKLQCFCYYLCWGAIIIGSSINNQDKVINNEKKYSLTIQIEDVIIIKGILYLAIYTNENDFMKKPYLMKKYISPNFPKKLVFRNLPEGEYAVTIYQDLNNNSRLDKFFSIPIEPYGISNNVKTFPKFKNSKVKLLKNKVINIKIKN